MAEGAALAAIFGTPGRRRYPIFFAGVPVTRFTRWRYHAMGRPGSGTTPDVTCEDAAGNRHVAVLTRPRNKSKLPLVYHPARPQDAHEPGLFNQLIVPPLPILAGLQMLLLAAGMCFGAE